MRVLWQLAVASLLLGLSGWSSAEPAGPAGAAELPAPAAPGRIAVPVRIGIAIEQIVEIDQKSENFTAVYSLRLSYREPALAYERVAGEPPFKTLTFNGLLQRLEAEGLTWPNFVLDNMQGRLDLNIQSIDLFPDGTLFLFERATATFQAPDFDFRDYPFDTQRFYIRASLVSPTEVFVFKEFRGASGIGEQLGEEEWIISEWSSGIDTEKGLDGAARSTFSLSFLAHRHLVYYVVRIFIPMMIILLVSWFTFRLKDYVKRIDLGITVLLLFIAFNFTLGSDLPRLGYLTAVDAFIAGTFVITGAVILINVQLRLLQNRGEAKAAERLDRVAIYGYWPAYIIGMSAALLMI